MGSEPIARTRPPQLLGCPRAVTAPASQAHFFATQTDEFAPVPAHSDPLTPQPSPEAPFQYDLRPTWTGSRKLPLPPPVTDPHMPTLYDKRKDAPVTARASVLFGKTRTYLVSSSTDQSGASGKLRVAIDLDSDEASFIKVVRSVAKKTTTPEQTRAGRRQTRVYDGDLVNLRDEVEMTANFSELQAFFYDDQRLFFVMPYGKIGLREMGCFGEATTGGRAIVRAMTHELLHAVGFLQQRDVAHCDIKSDNVVYDPILRRFRLIDFGNAARLHPITKHSIAEASFGTYPPPSRFADPLTFGRASAYDDHWGIATVALHAMGGVRRKEFDPFDYRTVRRKGRKPFEKWFDNMREGQPSAQYDMTLDTRALDREESRTVFALHTIGNRAFCFDPELALFLVDNIFNLSTGPSFSAFELMWKMSVPSDAQSQPVMTQSLSFDAHDAIAEALYLQPVSEADRLLQGLYRVAQDPIAASAIHSARAYGVPMHDVAATDFGPSEKNEAGARL